MRHSMRVYQKVFMGDITGLRAGIGEQHQISYP